MRQVTGLYQHASRGQVDARDHLAIDETMLLWAEEDQGPVTELMRVWQFDRPTVVLGRSSRVADEVDREYCEASGIPILRRCSGGATVVGGPGCLMYSVVLSFEQKPELQKIDVAHTYVMARVLRAVKRQLPSVTLQGICDLTWQNRKCSGNSLRVARHHLLYHGTLLHDFDLNLLSRCLTDAPRQPAYRGGRRHDAFVTNVPLDPQVLTSDLLEVFGSQGTQDPAMWDSRIADLRKIRYDQPSWHFRH